MQNSFFPLNVLFELVCMQISGPFAEIERKFKASITISLRQRVVRIKFDIFNEEQRIARVPIETEAQY